MTKFGLPFLVRTLALALVALSAVVLMTMGAIAGWVAGFVFPPVFESFRRLLTLWPWRFLTRLCELGKLAQCLVLSAVFCGVAFPSARLSAPN